ncbi:hypothetical protein YC2023_019188 [Brassica napus]
MKLRQEARLAVMKVEEEEEARSDCSSEFAFDALRNQHKRQKRIHHHQSIRLSFQKARGDTKSRVHVTQESKRGGCQHVT